MFNLPNYNLSGSVDSAEELLNSLFNKDQAKIIAKFINESIDYSSRSTFDKY